MEILQKYYYISTGKNPELIKGLPVQNTINYYISANTTGGSESYNLYIVSNNTIVKNYDSSFYQDEIVNYNNIKLHWRDLKGTGVSCIKNIGVNYTETIVEVTPNNNDITSKETDCTTYFLVVDFKYEYDYLKYQLPQKYLTLIQREFTRDEYMNKYIELTMHNITDISASYMLSVNHMLPDGEGDLTFNLYNLNDVDVVEDKSVNVNPEYYPDSVGKFLMLDNDQNYRLNNIVWSIIKGPLELAGEPANPALYDYIIRVARNSIDFGEDNQDINYYLYNIYADDDDNTTIDLKFRSPTTKNLKDKCIKLISSNNSIISTVVERNNDLYMDFKVSNEYINALVLNELENWKVNWNPII